MAKIKKRGDTGSAKNFITRTQAVKKLQVSLADFRRLCIFKGIYPREPRNKKKANKGSTAPVTFYYAKDIQYLMHEPVLAKFREHKTFAKKLQRALGRGEVTDALKLELNRPQYTLEHIIKERYPTFMDALRDLDDPLNMLFLFANLPTTDKVSHRVTKEAERLCNQWLAYVAKERLVTKVFVSIKGVYYQATVKGQEVRWLVPFKFPTNIPTDVDFRIMLTFLEFYSTLLHFVLFRLYHDAELIYPPTIDIEKLKGIGGLSSYVLQSKQHSVSALLPQEKPQVDSTAQASTLLSDSISRALEANESADADDADNAQESVQDVELDTFESRNKDKGDALVQPSKYSQPASVVFSNFVFFVGREVLLDILELLLLSGGGKVISEVAMDELRASLPDAYARLNTEAITHHICDRPKLTGKVPGRTYVQPQWVFDCINKGELLPVSAYAPGEVLPPHLSPWGDAGIYDPSKEHEIETEEAQQEDDVEIGGEDEDEDDEQEDADLVAQRELELEAEGVKFSERKSDDLAKKPRGKKRLAEEEEKELKKIMMTNKQRKLYSKMQHGINQKEARQEDLSRKRQQIEKKKKELKKV